MSGRPEKLDRAPQVVVGLVRGPMSLRMLSGLRGRWREHLAAGFR